MGIKGYKAFNADLTCNDFQYAIGETYEMDDCELCDHGFHFCKNIADCFSYYNGVNDRFAEVEALGEIIESDEDSKCVTNKIRIIKEIPRSVAVDMSNSGNCNSGNCNSGNCNSGNRNSGDCNSGDWNSGDCNSGNWNSGNRNSGDCNSGNWNSGNWNSGDCNSGDWNSGNWNSGDWNSGNWNSGDWNSGDWNSGNWNTCNFSAGCFNTEVQMITMFNKPTNWTLEDFWDSEANRILNRMPVAYTELIWTSSANMSDAEKAEHPGHETTGGFLKSIEYKADRQAWWDELSEKEKRIVMNLPNFDAEIFKECTGIDVRGV